MVIRCFQCKRSFKYQPAVRLQKRVDSLRVDCRRMWMVCKTCAWKTKWKEKPRKAMVGIQRCSHHYHLSFTVEPQNKKGLSSVHMLSSTHLFPQTQPSFDGCACNCALPVINSSLKRSVTRRSTKGCTNCSPHRAPLAEPYLTWKLSSKKPSKVDPFPKQPRHAQAKLPPIRCTKSTFGKIDKPSKRKTTDFWFC